MRIPHYTDFCFKKPFLQGVKGFSFCLNVTGWCLIGYGIVREGSVQSRVGLVWAGFGFLIGSSFVNNVYGKLIETGKKRLFIVDDSEKKKKEKKEVPSVPGPSQPPGSSNNPSLVINFVLGGGGPGQPPSQPSSFGSNIHTLSNYPSDPLLGFFPGDTSVTQSRPARKTIKKGVLGPEEQSQTQKNSLLMLQATLRNEIRRNEDSGLEDLQKEFTKQEKMRKEISAVVRSVATLKDHIVDAEIGAGSLFQDLDALQTHYNREKEAFLKKMNSLLQALALARTFLSEVPSANGALQYAHRFTTLYLARMTLLSYCGRIPRCSDSEEVIQIQTSCANLVQQVNEIARQVLQIELGAWSTLIEETFPNVQTWVQDLRKLSEKATQLIELEQRKR